MEEMTKKGRQNFLWMKWKNRRDIEKFFVKRLKKGRRKFVGNEKFFYRKFKIVWRSEIFPFSAVVNFP